MDDWRKERTCAYDGCCTFTPQSWNHYYCTEHRCKRKAANAKSRLTEDEKFEQPREFKELSIRSAPDGYRVLIINDLQRPFHDQKTLTAVENFWGEFKPNLEIYNGDIADLYCVAPETKILTADLRWVAAEQLRAGDKLLAFDEYPVGTCRRWRVGHVLRTGLRKLSMHRLTLDSGAVLYSTPEHRWLYPQKNGWIRTDEITTPSRWWQKTRLRKLLNVWPALPTNTYLGGILDGEGSIGGLNNGPGLSIQIGQNPGRVLDEIKRQLRINGFSFSEGVYRGSQGVHLLFVTGGLAEQLRLLGHHRPVRFLDEVALGLEGKRAQAIAEPCVLRNEFIGERWAVTLETDPPTYVADGFGAHNTISSFDTNPSRRFHLQDELDDTAAWLANRVKKNPSARRLFGDGNHEDRLRRWLYKHGPELYSLRCLDLNELLNLEGFERLDYGSVIDFLGYRIEHGYKTTASKAYPVNTSRWMAIAVGSSGLCGHTHHFSTYSWTDSRGSHSYTENGCLCRFDMDYAPFPNWQQAFSYGVVHRNKVHLVPVLVYGEGFRAEGEFYERR